VSERDRHSADRTLQLLADRATEGVNEKETAVLNELLAADPAIDSDGFDRAAACVAIAMIPHHEETLPASLRSKILTDAETFFGRGERV